MPFARAPLAAPPPKGSRMLRTYMRAMILATLLLASISIPVSAVPSFSSSSESFPSSFASSSPSSSSSSGTAPTQRNVLFLLEDDGSMDFGVYGNSVIHTPNVDRLAGAGTLFTSAYTHVSSCSPSRAALLSGLPSHQNGMYGLQHGVEHFSSFDRVVSAANALNDAGYITGIIGKFHVAPTADFNFTWGNNPDGPGGCQSGASPTCPNTDYNLVTRNITYMAEQARLFTQYAEQQGKPFFLYIGFGDSHRCGGPVGEFCQFFGFDKMTQQSTIPDWKPIYYTPEQVTVPYWIQDTPIARGDLAGMYTAKNRLDQGVGLLLDIVWDGGAREKNTMIIYLADNGAPYASGKTNFYEPGSVEPLIVVAPGLGTPGSRTDSMATSLDMFPTILDWLQVPLPSYTLNGARVRYQGRSLLPIIAEAERTPPSVHTHLLTAAQLESRYNTPLPSSPSTSSPSSRRPPPPLPSNYTAVFHSFQLHEIQMYYPMRAVHAQATPTARYHLIYNIAHFLPYPIASDLWLAPSTQDLIARAQAHQDTKWYRNITAYLQTPRPKYELFDLEVDPMELNNVAGEPAYAGILAALQQDIQSFQTNTNDDWLSKYIHE